MRNWMVVATLVLAGLAGCGSAKQSPEDAVRATLTKFRDASATKDYQTICDALLSQKLVDNVTQYGLPCELAIKQGLGDVRDPKLTIGEVTVKGTRASARITTTAQGQKGSTDTITLLLVDDEWRIASLG